MEALPTYETGVYAKIRRDAAAANEARALSAMELWDKIFNDASLWFEPDADRITRPTEFEALRNVCAQARGARSLYEAWERLQTAELFGEELGTLAANVPDIAAQTARETAQAARRAELKAIRESQLKLPLGIAA